MIKSFSFVVNILWKMVTRIPNIIAPLLSVIIFFSCNTKEGSPFGDLLYHQPYASLTDSIKKEPKRDELYFRRAVLLNKNNFPEPALADFEKAWSLRKDERYAIGISRLLLEKRADSAILFLNAAIKELPQSILLQLNLARAYDAQNKTGDALMVCDKILQIYPDNVDILKFKAQLLDKKNDSAGAISFLEKAYSLAPFDVDLNNELAYKYAETKNPKAISLCDSLIKMDSLKVHAEPYYCKGLYYSNINDKSRAIEFFDAAIQHDYTFLDPYLAKGKVYYDQKKYSEAKKVFLQIISISSTLPDAYYWLGRSQEALGEKDEARLNYQRAYGLDKTFTEAKEAADRIKN